MAIEIIGKFNNAGAHSSTHVLAARPAHAAMIPWKLILRLMLVACSPPTDAEMRAAQIPGRNQTIQHFDNRIMHRLTRVVDRGLTIRSIVRPHT